MKRAGIWGTSACAIMLLAGCGKIGGDAKQDSPQNLVSSSAGSGGRVTPASPAVAAQAINFGDDSGAFSKDGECDDKRFAGPGMTDTRLLESDVGHDATDCRTAFDQKRLTLAGSAPAATGSYAASGVDHIMWGDDASKFSRDGECDDKRFDGAGMTATPLLDSDVKHDATDCRTAFGQGRLSLKGG